MRGTSAIPAQTAQKGEGIELIYYVQGLWAGNIILELAFEDEDEAIKEAKRLAIKEATAWQGTGTQNFRVLTSDGELLQLDD